jgi:hypothetical protein
VYFKIKKSTQLKKLMEAYCARQILDLDQIRFMFDGNLLRGSQTPGELEMVDDDVIDALIPGMLFHGAGASKLVKTEETNFCPGDRVKVQWDGEGQRCGTYMPNGRWFYGVVVKTSKKGGKVRVRYQDGFYGGSGTHWEDSAHVCRADQSTPDITLI